MMFLATSALVAVGPASTPPNTRILRFVTGFPFVNKEVAIEVTREVNGIRRRADGSSGGLLRGGSERMEGPPE